MRLKKYKSPEAEVYTPANIADRIKNIGSQVKTKLGAQYNEFRAKSAAKKAAKNTASGAAKTATKAKSTAKSTKAATEGTKLKSWFDKFKNSKAVSGTVNFAKAHPFQTAGLGILGGANLAGLFDNDKVGGQLGGAALGGAGSLAMHALGGVSGVPLAWAPLIGGALGSLWDKSREAKDREQQQLQALQTMAAQRYQ